MLESSRVRVLMMVAAVGLAGCATRQGAPEGAEPADAESAPAARAEGRAAPAPDLTPRPLPPQVAPELTPEERAAARVERLEVRVEPETIVVGDQASLSVTGYDAAGDEVSGFAADFRLRGGTVEVRPAEGVVIGKKEGASTVIALVRPPGPAGERPTSVRDSASVTVLPVPVQRITVSLPATLYAGTRSPATATAYTRHGIRQAPVVWTSSDERVVQVSPHGVASAVAPGRARVEATAEGVTGSALVEVVSSPVRRVVLEPSVIEVQVGDVAHFSAEALDAQGARVVDVPIEWSVSGLRGSAGGWAEVDAEGVFVANDAGLYRVTATVGAVAAVAEVEATARPLRGTVKSVAHGVVPPEAGATTDLWVFEGRDGRDYAYTGTLWAATMYAWDVTDPANPVITDSVKVDGRRANDVKINQDATLAIITSEGASNRRNGFTILDISDPAHPRPLTHFTEGLTGGVHNVWIEGDIVYAAHNGTAALHIVDISDPTSPRNVGRWNVPNEGRMLHDVMVKDGLAYLSYWNDGLIILDVGAGIKGGTPTTPVLVSQHAYQYPIGDAMFGNTHHAIRYENFVFLADEIFDCSECGGGSWPRGHVHVIDVTDIESPREVAWYEVPEAGAHNMWVEDDKLYVGYYQGGLRVVDISGELRGDLYRQGREIGVFMTEDAKGAVPNATMTWGPQPYKGKIFVSDLNSGLWVLELEAPAPPLLP